jgi:putative CocE/NonD family hydrolase
MTPKRTRLIRLLVSCAVILPQAQAQAQAQVQGKIRAGDYDRGPIPLPAPKYKVASQRSVMIKMRDGVGLSTDIYRAVGAEDRLPTILIRTPYSKTGFNGRMEQLATMFASQGYVVAVQDKRGRFESEGVYVVQGGDPNDGYDTVDWLSKQPWSNGRVGTAGCSYMGDVQILAAQKPHPALRAMIPAAAGSSIGSAGGQYKYFGARFGGTVAFAQNLSWFYDNGTKIFYHPPENLPRDEVSAIAKYFDPAPKKVPANYPKLWWHLPLVDVMKLADVPPNDFADVVSRDVTDPWWDQFNYMTDNYRSDVPALHVNSWYDFGARETIYEFETMRKNSLSATARNNQFLIMSPTTHCRSEVVKADDLVGERDLGDARLNYWDIYLRWFDYWLKDRNDIFSMPRVQYYLMGKNEWRTAADWPIPGTQFTKFYLHSGGSANSLNGDGTLSPVAPGDEPADRFVYDPGNPVPTLGGPMCCTESNTPSGSVDQRKVEIRQDVLVYTSAALKEGIEVTGVIDVVLNVSSDARDTDFTAKLIDVYPDGRAFNVQEGILRARYRQGQAKKVWLEAGKVAELRIDVGATSNYFGPGHRIRVEISSSNFPRFDRNLNTGGNNYDETKWIVARNAVHHSRANPSYIILPVVGRKIV